MTAGELTQLVAFHTDLPAGRFADTWRPFAAGFLERGLRTITLAEFAAAGQIQAPRFLSRNTWPAADYHRAFPGGLAADGAGGPVTVRQAGVFAVHPDSPRPTATARPDLDLTVALLRLTDPEQADPVIQAMLGAVLTDPARQLVAYRGAHPAQRYQVAVTVHGPAGTGIDSAAALQAALRVSPIDVTSSVVLTGRELLSLPS